MMSISEAMAYLEVSRPTIYRMIADGRVQALPKVNPARIVEPRRLVRASVLARRPDKAPQPAPPA